MSITSLSFDKCRKHVPTLYRPSTTSGKSTNLIINNLYYTNNQLRSPTSKTNQKNTFFGSQINSLAFSNFKREKLLMLFALEMCLKGLTENCYGKLGSLLILKLPLAEIRYNHSGKTIFQIGHLALFDVSEVENNFMKENAFPWNSKYATNFGMKLFKSKMWTLCKMYQRNHLKTCENFACRYAWVNQNNHLLFATLNLSNTMVSATNQIYNSLWDNEGQQDKQMFVKVFCLSQKERWELLQEK